MVPRAGTLVPISESETKLTYQVPGFSQHRRCVIARGRLRRRTAQSSRPPPSGAPPQSPQTARRGPRGPSPAGGAPPRLRRRLRGHSRAPRGRLRAWEGPRRGGGLRVSLRSLPGRPPGLRRSSRRVLRRSRFRCPLGFPFSLSPCCTSILSTATPRVKPQQCVLSHISGRHKLPNGKTKGSSFQLRTRNLPRSNLRVRQGNLPHGNLPPSNIRLRSSNLRLRR